MRYLLLILCFLLPLPALAEGLYILPVKLLDTSNEARDQSAEHARRLGLMAEVLAKELPAQPIGAERIAASCAGEDPECLLGMLRDEGADRGLFIVVQKTSTLILQVFASVVDSRDQSLIAYREMNFRGDNDEAWRRAAVFLARDLRGAL